MELLKAISSIKSLNSYISLTDDFTNKYESAQIPLNMSTALALKKMQCLELKVRNKLDSSTQISFGSYRSGSKIYTFLKNLFQYFSRFQKGGLAFMLLETILKLPASKKWALLGQKIIPVLLYWLEGVRKHLIIHSQNWWIFLESLLKFINVRKQKCWFIWISSIGLPLFPIICRKPPTMKGKCVEYL